MLDLLVRRRFVRQNCEIGILHILSNPSDPFFSVSDMKARVMPRGRCGEPRIGCVVTEHGQNSSLAVTDGWC